MNAQAFRWKEFLRGIWNVSRDGESRAQDLMTDAQLSALYPIKKEKKTASSPSSDPRVKKRSSLSAVDLKS